MKKPFDTDSLTVMKNLIAQAMQDHLASPQDMYEALGGNGLEMDYLLLRLPDLYDTPQLLVGVVLHMGQTLGYYYAVERMGIALENMAEKEPQKCN
jgi:hypothetical protein